MIKLDKVVIVACQFSVIVKGIEKHLTEMGYKVKTIKNEIEAVTAELNAGDQIYIIYLPPDCLETKQNREILAMTSTIRERKQKMIFIGDDKVYDGFTSTIPFVKSYPWMDRPIDNDELLKLIDKVADEEVAAGNKERILIVDDDPSYAKMIREWLKDRYQVDVVVGGMQAITFLFKNKVSLILLDYEMPVVDGPQVLQMLKEDNETADIPVIFLTGISTRESVTRVMALKPAGYILKSTTKADLIQNLSDFFAKSKQIKSKE